MFENYSQLLQREARDVKTKIKLNPDNYIHFNVVQKYLCSLKTNLVENNKTQYLKMMMLEFFKTKFKLGAKLVIELELTIKLS